MPATAKYCYERLDLDGPAIRLVRLLKGSGAEIKCQIFQAWLYGDSTIPYEALSYVWGSSSRPERIIVDGKELDVTENLYFALRDLRQGTDRLLWVDAISINQDDVKERGHQVQQMSRIYNEAERVIVWLGSPTYETNVLMDSLQCFQKKAAHYPTTTWRTSDIRWSNVWLETQLAIKDRHSDLASRQRAGLQSLLARPWFERIWILQEVANAKTAIICCGLKQVSSRMFVLAPTLVKVEISSQSQAVLDIMPGPSRKESWWSENRGLSNLLLKFGQSRATDPRDMIFALFGIASDSDKIGLQVDYSNSIAQLIDEVHRYLFGYTVQAYQGISHFIEDLPSLASNCLLSVVLREDAFVVEGILQRHRGHIEINDSLIAAACNGGAGGFQIMHRLLTQSDDMLGCRDSLVVASKCGNVDVIRLLLDNEARFQAQGIGMPFPAAIDAAMAGKHMEVVRRLLQHGAKFTDHSALMWAASQQGFDDIVQQRLEMGADVNYKSKQSKKRAALYEASDGGYLKTVQLLLKNGADVNAEDETALTALHAAAAKEHTKIVQELLRAGADVNSSNASTSSPLQMASRNGNFESVKLLLDGGAFVDTDDGSHSTALLEASNRGNARIVEMLIAERANVSHVSKGKEVFGTALQGSSISGSTTTVRILLKNGADVNQCCEPFGTALQVASLMKHEEIMKLLLDAGANPNLRL